MPKSIRADEDVDGTIFTRFVVGQSQPIQVREVSPGKLDLRLASGWLINHKTFDLHSEIMDKR